MKLTKRILCLALALVLTFAICACGKKDKKDPLADERSNNLPSATASTTTTTEKKTTTSTTTDPLEGNLDGEQITNDGAFGEW